MANNTTKIIKFRAQFEETKGFGKWLQDIEKNIDMSVDNSFTKWIKSYKTRLEALEKTMKNVGDKPSDNVMSSMHKEMKGMLEISRKIANEFSKMSLGGASKQLEAAAKAVQDASRAKKNASSNKRNWENKKSVDGQTLSDNELKRIFDKNSAKGFDFNGIKFGGDGGAGLAEFIEEVKKNIELLQKAEDGIAKTIQDRFNQVESEIKKYGTEAAQAAKDLEEARAQFAQAATAAISGGAPDTSGLAVEGQERVNKMSIASDETSDAIKAHEDEVKAKTNATIATADYNKESAKTPNVVAKAAKQVFAYGTVVSLFKKLISGARKTITELDAAFTDMAVVTNLTRKEAWGMVDDFQKVAKETGAVTSEVAATTTKFLQQGKSLSQATQLSEAALKAAKIAGIDASRSVDLLTNAMNGFQMSASQALEVSDKFAALAASSATSYEELAVALSKVAAQANLAGMSMDFTLGMLAKGIEVTREAPETIGTALKTVIARMRELSDYGETLEEGMDVNRVETALENVGVKLRDTNGQFRNLEDVLTELGGKWNELNINQQANVAVALAGTRQQSRLIAMMQDFDRTLELVDISTNSYGATMAQHMEYMESMKAATDGLKTSYEGLVSGLMDSDVLIGLVNGIAKIVDFADLLLNQYHLLIPVMVVLSAYALNILHNKILMHKYAVAQHKIEMLNTLEKNKQRKQEIAQQKAQKIAYKDTLRTLKQEIQKTAQDKKQLELTLKAAIAEADLRKDEALKLKLQHQLNQLQADNLDTAVLKKEIQDEIIKTDAEINSLKTEEALLSDQIAAAEASTTNFAFGFLNILSGIPMLLGTILGIHKLISAVQATELALQEGSNAAQKKGIAYGIARWNQERKNAREQGKSMFGSVVTAFGQLGPWGVVAGIAIAAALVAALGVGIGAAVSASVPNKKEDTSNTEGNIKAMQKLQAEIYNLGNTVNTVSSLGEEFEELSSKINKTAEDTQRLKEIITEFNDAAGYEVVDSTMTYTEAMNAMRAYEASVTAELKAKVKESNETLKSATQTAKELTAYLNDDKGRAVIQQNLAQNYSDFGNANETTQAIILDAIAQNASKFLGKDGGLDYSEIEKIFSASDIEAMNNAVVSGSLQEYKNALNAMDEATRKYIESSDSLFKHVATWSDEVVTSIDNLSLTADQMAKLSPFLKTNADNLEEWIKENNGQTLSRAQLMSKLYENRNAETVAGNAEDAQKALDEYLASDEYKKFKKRQKWVEEAGSLEEADLKDKNVKIYEEGVAKLGALKAAVEETTQAEKIANMSVQEWWNTYGNIPSLADLQDGIDKANSSMEKFSKFAAGSLDAKEMDEMLNTYPELVDYMADGVVTAQELNEARNEIFNKQLDELEAALELIEAKNSQIMEESLKGTGVTWEQIKNMDADAVEQLLNGLTSLDQEVKDATMAAWRDYQQTKIKTENFADSLGMTDSEIKKVSESTGLKLAEAQYNAYKDELALYSEDDPAYASLLGQSMNVASTAIQAAKKKKDELHKQIQKSLGNYDFEIIDGNIYYKNEQGLLQSLDSLEGATKQAFATVADSMSDILTEYSEAAETEKEYAENIANEYVEMRNKELEADKETLEKRKEAYEKYFDRLDAMESAAERTQSKEAITAQIARLSTGIDSASKKKVAELREELAELEKEERQAYRDELRNKLLENIDDQTEKLDENMQKLDESIGTLTRALLAQAGGLKFEYVEGGGTLTKQIEQWLNSSGIPGFSKGGIVDYTGLAMVHGSSSAPESFLDAQDTSLLSQILEGLHLLASKQENSNNDIETDGIETISIENIIINAEKLNNSVDFKAAGSVLASEFMKIIKERGINVNARK